MLYTGVLVIDCLTVNIVLIFDDWIYDRRIYDRD